DRHRVVDAAAADHVGHHAHLAGRLAELSENCACHVVSPWVPYFAAGAEAAGAPPAAALRSPECPWKVRVGANSPSLCPTMFSVTNTGRNLRPLCTAKVSPTMSGMIVERRDQVLITFFDFCRCMSATLAVRCVSMKGPFPTERDMARPSILGA